MNNMSGRVDDIFVLGGGGTATQFYNGSNPDLHPSQEWRCHVEGSETSLVHFRWNGRSNLDPRFFALLRMTICDAFYAVASSLSVRRRKASRYFADVFSTTSFGKRGAGGVLSQSSVSR